MYETLKSAIDDMPLDLAVAMLRGFDQPIAAGAFVHDGAACPILIGRRNGARHARSYLRFARAWDRYCEVRDAPRVVDERERIVLRSLLQRRVYGVEQQSRRERCEGCERALHLDHFGDCARCGRSAVDAIEPRRTSLPVAASSAERRPRGTVASNLAHAA